MSLEWVATEDLLVNFSNNKGPGDLVYTGDVGLLTPGVSATTSTKCKILTRKVATTSIILTWLQLAVPPATCPHTSVTHNFNTGAGVVLATATKVTAEGSPVLRDADTGVPAGCVGLWILPPATLVPCQCDITISSAGQVKAKAQ